MYNIYNVYMYLVTSHIYTLDVFKEGSTFGIGMSCFNLDSYKKVISEDNFIFFLK